MLYFSFDKLNRPHLQSSHYFAGSGIYNVFLQVFLSDFYDIVICWCFVVMNLLSISFFIAPYFLSDPFSIEGNVL